MFKLYYLSSFWGPLYAGVVPFEQSSGRKRGKTQVSRIANKKVKALLHLAALSASLGPA
uniref:transposase n=1 Tax=Spirosoma utsteinense TaxID=2585773 RepID=UPI00293BF13F|nr:transposase [Spirosoma utsteinense]